MAVTVKKTTVNCPDCWKKPYTAGSERAAQQIAQHHRGSRGHKARRG